MDDKVCASFTEDGELFYNKHHDIVREIARIARGCAEGFKEFHHSEFMRLACNRLALLTYDPNLCESMDEIIDSARLSASNTDTYHLIESYTSKVADKRTKELQSELEEEHESHEEIASMCFKAGAVAGYGTSISAVQSLVEILNETRIFVGNMRKYARHFSDCVFYTHKSCSCGLSQLMAATEI